MGDYSLKKQEIFRGYQALKDVLDKGTKISGNYVSLYHLDGFGRKVGFIVSKRYRKSVQRNRIRRLLRELYRRNKNIFPEGKILLYGKYFSQLPTYCSYLRDVLNTLNGNTINGE